MNEEPLRFTVVEGLASIRLNRPLQLNAFDAELAHAWRSAATEATSRPDIGAVLIETEGKAFSAGGDLRAIHQMRSGAQLTELANVINEGIRALIASSVAVIAAVRGTVVGGGLGILLASDYAIADSSVRVGSLYAAVGLTPDLSVSASLAAAVGERRALQLLLQDRLLDADEALSWGLVAEVVERGECDRRAREVAETWLSGATRSYGDAKRLIRSRSERSFAEQLHEEARTIGSALDRSEARSRIDAFINRAG